MAIRHFDQEKALDALDNLRYGIPPADEVCYFTVGRQEELEKLKRTLHSATGEQGRALLVRANFGAGKSHLLKVIREMALNEGFAVSLVVVNALEGVRFNRMDTILGAVCRELEVPGVSRRGAGQLLSAYQEPSAKLAPRVNGLRDEISNWGGWDYTERLQSDAMYVALRAWMHADDEETRDLIRDWLANPPNYRGQRKLLYNQLIANFAGSFSDPRREWEFYNKDVFIFHTDGHENAWLALADLNTIARGAGLRGLVLLFDEFEDVVQNLVRRDYKHAAFQNLFTFFEGDHFPGVAYFAVTPDFAAKCNVLLSGGEFRQFKFKRFEDLRHFELAPISRKDFSQLAKQIRSVHGDALAWDAVTGMPDSRLAEIVAREWAGQSPERIRFAVQAVVEALDEKYQEKG
jgi:hypothetical protein